MNRNEKRLLLRAILKLMTAVALIVSAAVLVSGLFGGGGERASTRLRVALGELAPGELRRIEWAGRPLLLLHRDAAMLAALRDPAQSAGLRDADGDWSEQPEGLPAETRSRQPEYFVALAVGSDLGCALRWLPAGGEFRGRPWPGGFADTCRGSRYDLAGRVFDDQQAQRNLQVPDYRIDGGALLFGE